MRSAQFTVRTRKSVNGKRNYVYFAGSLTVNKKHVSSYDKIVLKRSKTILPIDEPLIIQQLGKQVEFIDMEWKNNFVKYQDVK
jgi:hypothetical protein